MYDRRRVVVVLYSGSSRALVGSYLRKIDAKLVNFELLDRLSIFLALRRSDVKPTLLEAVGTGEGLGQK